MLSIGITGGSNQNLDRPRVENLTLVASGAIRTCTRLQKSSEPARIELTYNIVYSQHSKEFTGASTVTDQDTSRTAQS